MSTSTNHDLYMFCGLIALAATAVALALPGTDDAPGPVALLTLLIPALAATALRWYGRGRGCADKPACGVRRAAWRGWPVAAGLAAAAITSSFAVAWALGVVDFDGLASYAANAPFQIAFLSILLLGEELGWRGYLLPRLLQQQVPPRRAALVTGVAHALFHIPLLTLTSAYVSDGRRVLVVPGVVAVVTAGGVVFGWLRIHYGSLWPVLIAHATVNVCLLSDPELVTAHPARAAYLTGEGGLITMLTVATVAAIVWRYGDWSPTKSAPGAARRNSATFVRSVAAC